MYDAIIYSESRVKVNQNVGNMECLKCNKCSAVAEMGDRLATIDMGRKLGAMHPLGAESPCDTMWPGPRSIPSYQMRQTAS